MTGEDLYQHLKSALRHFGLEFAQMDLLTVTVEDGNIHFDHGGLRVTVMKGWK